MAQWCREGEFALQVTTGHHSSLPAWPMSPQPPARREPEKCDYLKLRPQGLQGTLFSEPCLNDLRTLDTSCDARALMEEGQRPMGVMKTSGGISGCHRDWRPLLAVGGGGVGAADP